MADDSKTHTPGPWEPIRDSDADWPYGWLLVGPSGAVGYWRGHKSHHNDRYWLLTEADARLIAASPTMADVLADAPVLSRYHGRYGYDVERFVTDYDAWMARRRAALSLATGKEG